MSVGPVFSHLPSSSLVGANEDSGFPPFNFAMSHALIIVRLSGVPVYVQPKRLPPTLVPGTVCRWTMLSMNGSCTTTWLVGANGSFP